MIEDFISADLCFRRELEGVQSFASGSDWGDAVLHMRHQRVGVNNTIQTTNQSNAWRRKVGWSPVLGTQLQFLGA